MEQEAATTCQCLVTAFQTPTLPVLLVAISWLPTKKSASAGTFRLKTPEEKSQVRGNLRFKCFGQSSAPTNFIPVASWTDGPKNDLCHRGNGHHLIIVSQ